MKKLISRTRLNAFVVVALLVCLCPAVSAQHEGHDMSKVPGVNKPKSKPKKKSSAARKRQPAQTERHPSNVVEGDDTEPSEATPAAPSQVGSPAPQPSPTPTNVHKHEPAPTTSSMPDAVVEPEATNPSPVSPSPTADQPQPGAPHKHDSSDMNQGGAGKLPQPSSGAPMEGMKGMIHPSSGTHIMAEGHTHELLLMSDGMMDIRVGEKQHNFLGMGQMGSGTSWQPSTTPMHMWSKITDKWLIFIHAEAKLGANRQGGPRGITKFESENWIMPMAFRRVGHGTLQLRGMFSLEPFTFSPGGSPQLFQTGETYKGKPIIDKQHPHDLFMELSATYTVPIGERSTWFAYVGFPGEPSLGPTAFMHRASASENPTAPLSHHLQDSSHISFGVFSTGFTYRWFKLEGSFFNGREPDENRYDFEFNPWNSRAVRFSIAPNKNWSMQWSYGLLKKPEALKTGDVRRMTASLNYNKRFERGNWATSLIWGRNDENHANDVETLNGYVAESTLNFQEKNYVYTRLELVDKVDLLSHVEATRLGIADHHAIFRIGAYTFGAARDIWNTKKFSLAVGGDLTFYSKSEILDSVYGNNPVSYKMFLRIRPVKMSMER